MPAPNRLVAYATAAAGLVTAVVPAIAHLNTSSTVGLVSGFGGIVAVSIKWLHGWQQMEKASQQDTLHALVTQREAAARAEQVAQATAPRSAVKLPR